MSVHRCPMVRLQYSRCHCLADRPCLYGLTREWTGTGADTHTHRPWGEVT